MEDPDVVKLFEDNKYFYHNLTMCYHNREKGKIFTQAYRDDNTLSSLMNNIYGYHEPNEWKIYMTEQEKRKGNDETLYQVFGKTPQDMV